MALFVRQTEQRTQLQEKLAAELKGKLKTQDIQAEKVESTILEDAHKTRPAGLVIGLLLILCVVVAVATMFAIG